MWGQAPRVTLGSVIKSDQSSNAVEFQQLNFSIGGAEATKYCINSLSYLLTQLRNLFWPIGFW